MMMIKHMSVVIMCDNKSFACKCVCVCACVDHIQMCTFDVCCMCGCVFMHIDGYVCMYEKEKCVRMCVNNNKIMVEFTR